MLRLALAALAAALLLPPQRRRHAPAPSRRSSSSTARSPTRPASGRSPIASTIAATRSSRPPTRSGARRATPPMSPAPSRRSTGRSCSSPTPTAAPWPPRRRPNSATCRPWSISTRSRSIGREQPRDHRAVPQRIRQGAAAATVPSPDGTAGTDLYVDPTAFHSLFAADVPARTAARMAGAQRPSPSPRSKRRPPRRRRAACATASPSSPRARTARSRSGERAPRRGGTAAASRSDASPSGRWRRDSWHLPGSDWDRAGALRPGAARRLDWRRRSATPAPARRARRTASTGGRPRPPAGA